MHKILSKGGYGIDYSENQEKFELKRIKFYNELEQYQNFNNEKDHSNFLNPKVQKTNYLNAFKHSSDIYAEKKKSLQATDLEEPNQHEKTIQKSSAYENQIFQPNQSPKRKSPTDTKHFQYPSTPQKSQDKDLELEDYENLPTEIDKIAMINERDLAFFLKEPSDISSEFTLRPNLPPHLQKNLKLEEFSITKENVYYYDEKIDINYMKDQSSYSRKVFRQEELDKKSIEMINPLFLKFRENLEDPSDEMCLDIAADRVSDAMIQNQLKQDNVGMNDLKRNLGLEMQSSDSDTRVDLKNEEKVVMQEFGCMANMVDMDGSTNTMVSSIKKKDKEEIEVPRIAVTKILNNLIKLKTLKKPMANLPKCTETVSHIVQDIDFKILDQIEILAQAVLEKQGGSFEKNLAEIMENLPKFRNQYIDGVHKSRLIKLILTEVSEIKKCIDMP